MDYKESIIPALKGGLIFLAMSAIYSFFAMKVVGNGLLSFREWGEYNPDLWLWIGMFLFVLIALPLFVRIIYAKFLYKCSSSSGGWYSLGGRISAEEDFYNRIFSTTVYLPIFACAAGISGIFGYGAYAYDEKPLWVIVIALFLLAMVTSVAFKSDVEEI